MNVVDIIIQISALIGAFSIIGGAVYGIFLWFHKQAKQSEDIENLQTKEKEDIEALKKQEKRDFEDLKNLHSHDMDMINSELCMVSYGLLACLDGLKQLHCNGEVSKAHDKFQKHLNMQAHDLKDSG